MAILHSLHRALEVFASMYTNVNLSSVCILAGLSLQVQNIMTFGSNALQFKCLERGKLWTCTRVYCIPEVLKNECFVEFFVRWTTENIRQTLGKRFGCFVNFYKNTSPKGPVFASVTKCAYTKWWAYTSPILMQWAKKRSRSNYVLVHTLHFMHWLGSFQKQWPPAFWSSEFLTPPLPPGHSRFYCTKLRPYMYETNIRFSRSPGYSS